VVAVGRLRVPVEHLPELRRRPGPVPSPGLPATFLKNADEQTVLALVAVYQAIYDAGLEVASFGRWGVLAAPHKIGRTAMAQALPNYRAEGAWGMSPHLIPHRSLHSVSGTISCALKMHGPNFGVGGGPGEALPIAVAMLAEQRAEGLWLVLTAFDALLAPDTSGQPVPGSSGLGLALALTPAKPGRDGLRLRVRHRRPLGLRPTRRTPLDFFRMSALLDAPAGPRCAVLQDLSPAGRLELWVEGEVPAARRQNGHAHPILPPWEEVREGARRAAVPGYGSRLPSHAVEAQP
jgi:hypothetical protein